VANTITGLIPIIYEALDIVSRELVGLIPAVSRDPQVAQAAVGQTVHSPVVPAMAASDITPSNVSSTGTDRQLSFIDMTIQKARKVPFHLTGEQALALGPNNQSVARDSFAQAFRTLANSSTARARMALQARRRSAPPAISPTSRRSSRSWTTTERRRPVVRWCSALPAWRPCAVSRPACSR
jgi:hypothetical protein